MDWTNIDRMDPHLLVGVVNTALRNHFDYSLDDLCQTHAIDPEMLRQRLAQGGYEFLKEAKQFR